MSHQQINPDFLTVQQVATRLQLHYNVVYQMVRARSIPSVKIGRCIRISRPAFETWLITVDGDQALK